MVKKKSRCDATQVVFILCCSLLMLLGGCSGTQKNLSKGFGESVSHGLAAQVIHPLAPTDRTPVDSLTGGLASQIYQKRYVKMLTEDKEKNEDAASELSGLQ